MMTKARNVTIGSSQEFLILARLGNLLTAADGASSAWDRLRYSEEYLEEVGKFAAFLRSTKARGFLGDCLKSASDLELPGKSREKKLGSLLVAISDAENPWDRLGHSEEYLAEVRELAKSPRFGEIGACFAEYAKSHEQEISIPVDSLRAATFAAFFILISVQGSVAIAEPAEEENASEPNAEPAQGTSLQ